MGLFDGLPLDDGNSTLVATPNGPVRVPNQIASAFGPGAIASPVPQEPLPGNPGVAPGFAPEIAGAPGAPPQPAPAGPMPAPVIAPPPLPEIPIAGIKVPPPVRAPKPGLVVAPPAPDPFTAAQADHADATALGLQGIADKATAEAKQGDAEAAALAAQNLKTDQRQAQLDAFNKQQAAAQQEHIAGIDAATDAYAKSVVDPSRYWHSLSTGDKVLSGIGIALGAIGQGLTRGQDKNFGLEMVQKAIEQDVQQQMADRDKLKTVVGMKGQALEQLMMVTKDRNATEQAAIAAGYTRGAAEIQRIGAASKNPLVQANAKTASAQMLQDAATLKDQAAASSWKRKYDAAAQAEQLRHDHSEEGIAWAGHSETRREFDITDKFRNKQLDETLDEKAAEKAATLDAKRAAAVGNSRDFGVADAQGNPIYQPEGQALIDRAARLEAAAAKAPSPAAANAARMQAKALRDQALENTFQVPKEAVTAFRNQLASTQTAVSSLSELQKMIDDGSVYDLHNNARASTLFNTIKANAGAALKARFGEKTMETLDDIFGGDPTKLNRILDRTEFGTYGSRLEQIRKDLTEQAQQDARRAGYRGAAPVIADPNAPAPPELAAEKAVIGDKTAEENARASEPGAIAGAIDRIAYPLGGGKRSNPDYVREHEAPLSDAQQSQITLLAKGATNGNEKAAIALRGILGSDKPGLANPAFGIVRGVNADLADRLAGQLPAERRDQLLAVKPVTAKAFGALTDQDFETLSADEIGTRAAGDRGAAQSLVQRLTVGKGLDQAQRQKLSAAFAKARSLTKVAQ